MNDNTTKKLHNVSVKRINTPQLLISLTVWQIGILCYSFFNHLHWGACIILMGIVLFIFWSHIERFEPYKINPFKNKKFLFHQRDVRIKVGIFLAFSCFMYLQFSLYNSMTFSNRYGIKSPALGGIVGMITSIIIIRNAARANK